MKIGCLQFAPQVGDIENNLNRADAVLSKADPQVLDLLVLPELAFTGYNFRSLQDISPFLEPSGSGITSLWARTMALKYNCNVSVGYPEKVDVSGKWPTGPEYYNSNIVVNADGETIANYRKSFLYYTDQKWALEGPGGFYDGWIPGLGNTAIGICMDINPYKFEAPWDAFEFAYHILESESKVVIVSMAWITREESRSFSRMPQEPDMDTLTYWVTRLEPLIRSETDEEIIVVFCNRTGSEDEAIYAGTSAVIGICQGEVKVYGLLGRGTKELLVVDTTSAPFARLVYRPDAVTGKATTGDGSPNDHTVSASLDTPPLTSKADFDKGQARVSNGSFDAAITDKDSGFLAVAEHNNAISSTSSQRRNTLPPVPPPAPTLRDEDSLKAYKTPTIAPIQVHARLARMYDPDSARSSSSPSDFLIPSAVSSSTPPPPHIPGMCLWPKLVIPQSPATQRPRYSQGETYSASSEISHRSLQSIKSDQSESSVQTVTSNPRPPEDSTPYPHSGIPLSGYPANSLQPRKIYGGGVDISRLDSFSPTTPFDDISPVTSDWQWRNPGSTLQTPISGGGWMTGTPVGRRPKPFQWPVIQAMPVSNTKQKKDDKQASDKMNHDRKNDPNLSTEKIGAHPTASQLITTTEKNIVERPSSPKSRNASRSRKHTRSNSAASQHEATPAVANHLESIARRARSRSCSKTNTPGIERQSVSRASNRTSMQGPDDSIQPHGLGASRITPSPSLFDRNRPGASVIPTPAALDYYRNVPETQNQRSQSGTCIESSFAFMPPTANGRRSVVRIPSRGRRPEPREPVATPQNASKNAARSSSADSTRNDVLHRRESSRTHRPHGEQPSSKTSRARGQRRPSNGPDMRNFERVEAVLRPNCPVHGRRSESARNARDSRSSSEGQNRRRRSDSVGNMPLLLPATTYNPPLQDLSASRSITQSEYSSLNPATNTMADISVPITPKAPRQANFPPEIQQIAEDIAHLPDRPGTAPSSFYPATPKAMVFDIRDVNSEPTSAKADALSFATSHGEKGKAA